MPGPLIVTGCVINSSSDAAAMELGNHLCATPRGKRRLKRIILDEIDAARERGDHAAAAKLRLVVKHFVETHPKAA